MRRKKRTATPEQKQRRKKVFKTFSKLVLGAVKIWLAGTPYIILANEVDEFIQAFPDVETTNEER